MFYKKMLFFGFAVAALLAFSCNNDNYDNRHNGMMRDGRMGSGGMMGNRQGTGSDSSVYGRQGMMGQRQPNAENAQEPLTMEQAKERAREYLQNTGNTSLEMAQGMEHDNEYEFPLLNKSDNSRVASLMVDKKTGKIRSQQ